MVEKFRDEFEEHLERARMENPFAGDETPEVEPALVQGAVA